MLTMFQVSAKPLEWPELREYPTGMRWHEFHGVRNYTPARTSLPHSDRSGDVWCMVCLDLEGGCDAQVTGDSREEAVAAWNRRMPPNDKI